MADASEKIIYVPVLKWKQGEHGAVKPLSAAQKSQMLPIAELQDRIFDWKDEVYKKTWQEHLDKLAISTRTAWGKAHEIAIDMNSATMPELSKKARSRFFERLWTDDIRAVPVVGTYTSAAEIEELKQVSKAHGNGRWLLRFVIDQVAEELPEPSAVAHWFSALARHLAAPAAQVDAVIDLGHVAGWNVDGVAPAVAELSKAVSARGPWRTLALVGGAFPKNLAGYSKGTHQIARTDWALYLKARPLAKAGGRYPIYGDYGVNHIEAFDGDPRTLKMSANLRYAHWATWTIFKARSAIDFGFEQYLDLCKVLIELPIFLGATFSHGDGSYHEKGSNPAAKPGNASQWRREATNHHLHVVLHQLASLPAT